MKEFFVAIFRELVSWLFSKKEQKRKKIGL